MRCLIVDDVHNALIESLQIIGVSVDYLPEFRLEKSEIDLTVYQILVIRSKFPVGLRELDLFPALRLIARAGAGLDNLDEHACLNRGIRVVHAAEGNADAVAEHTMALILSLLNRLASADRSVRAGRWEREKFRGLEIKGRTVGILGYGNMGTALGLRLAAFGCRVIAYDKYRLSWPEGGVEKVALSRFFEETDILSVHLPLTTETRGMVDYAFLKNFPKGLFFINTARGPIVPLSDLVRLLEEGHLAAAGLDVLEKEPPAKFPLDADSPLARLFEMENVILSPHVAGWSAESYQKISLVLAEKIRQWVVDWKGERNFKTA